MFIGLVEEHFKISGLENVNGRYVGDGDVGRIQFSRGDFITKTR